MADYICYQHSQEDNLRARKLEQTSMIEMVFVYMNKLKLTFYEVVKFLCGTTCRVTDSVATVCSALGNVQTMQFRYNINYQNHINI